MITIERRLVFWKLKSYYFVQSGQVESSQDHIRAYIHSFIPKGRCREFQTLQFDLMKEQETLLMEMNKSTRRQIRRASEKQLEFLCLENPTNNDLQGFQTFYNEFARNKGTYTCNQFHLKTMKLLRDQNALMLTMVKDPNGVILCARTYIIDDDLVVNLYSSSHFRMSNDSDYKRLLGQANRYLVWKSLLNFKKKGCQLYDMGGLTDDENIRRFKLGFGGEVVTVYSGYKGTSLVGNLIVKLRDWKITFAKMRDIQ